MIRINMNKPIKTLIDEQPKIKEIMVSLGFNHITNPAMLNTVGKFMTIKQGAKRHKLDLDTVKQIFLENGFILEENNE